MKVDVISKDGTSTGRTVELPDSVFGVEPNEHAVYLAVKQIQAAQRQGTHKAKEKGEVTASTRKIKRQKGTGTARAGSLKSPVFRGGGRIFGPRPRNYDIKINKKVRRLARASALSHKVANGGLIVVEDFSYDAPKTKEFVDFLNKLEITDTKSLVVTKDYNTNVYLSGRNISNSGVVNAKDLNVIEILNANKLVVSEGSIDVLKKILA
jgi:large subunit ribosomal protein L4